MKLVSADGDNGGLCDRGSTYIGTQKNREDFALFVIEISERTFENGKPVID